MDSVSPRDLISVAYQLVLENLIQSVKKSNGDCRRSLSKVVELVYVWEMILVSTDYSSLSIVL